MKNCTINGYLMKISHLNIPKRIILFICNLELNLVSNKGFNAQNS